MVTADDILGIKIFAGLDESDREKLARAAADVTFAPGEYVAREGDERALFGLLEGRVEAVKVTDGIDRVVGQRHPGDIIGEVPIALATGFPVDFRAAERSRMMRIAPADYHAIVAVAPEVAEEVGKLASHRIGGPGGLQGLAADPPPPRAIVVGDRWDPSFAELRHFLDRNQISFTWLTPDAPDAAEQWGSALPAAEDLPILRVVDGGKTVIRPQLRRVAELLGLGTEAAVGEYDTVIVGTRQITHIDAATRQVRLDGDDVLRARTIIIACGVSWRQLAIEGFARLVGKGIWYGAARSEAPSTHGLGIHIVGAGNSAGQAAMFFSSHARSVTILCRGEGPEKNMSRYLIDQLATRSNIDILVHSEVAAAHGDASLEAIDVRNNATGETSRLESGGLFLFIGADAETGWLPPEIALDRRGYVLTGADVAATGAWELDRDPYLLETSVPGIFACGDVRSGPVKRVASAVGEGSMAIAFVHQYLKQADTRLGQGAPQLQSAS